LYPHRIRLRGPWECQPLARLAVRSDGAIETVPGPVPEGFRMNMPCRWQASGLHDFAGRARLRRRFGYPGRLDPTDRVWLTFEGVEGVAEVVLNETFLGRREGTAGAFEFEITELLRPRNELNVTVEALSGAGGLWGEVAMEVRCTAFLRSVRLWAVGNPACPTLHVAGEVVGFCERPLDLYVLLDNATVAYTTVSAAAAGQPFHLVAEPLEIKGKAGTVHEARIELVNGATVWYRIEQPFVFPGDLTPA
jgi:hypothetical protein